jgi:acetate kinase
VEDTLKSSDNLSTPGDCILAVNGGSSSVKFAVYDMEVIGLLLHGSIKNIGVSARLEYSSNGMDERKDLHLKDESFETVIAFLTDWIERQKYSMKIKAIGHRIVHGMDHHKPEVFTAELLQLLKEIAAYDPEHLPSEIELIEQFGKKFPQAIQVACFDTSFHASMPLISKLLPIPRRFFLRGIQRYGFHGISYEYLMSELNKMEMKPAAKQRVILAHLGSGSSLAAVKNNLSIETTMGFTPSSGVMMGTRTGDLDPGLFWYLIQSEKLTLEQFWDLINHQSGLQGISEVSSNVLDLLKLENKDQRAVEAIDLYCYQVKKAIGSLTASLGGLDTLVFSGGIGENSPRIRTRICEGLEFLGIELDEEMNHTNKDVISTGNRNARVRVIKTNEELLIARKVVEVLNSDKKA